MILFIIIMYKIEYVLFFKNSTKQKFTYIWINYRKESNFFFFLNIDTDTNVWNFWRYLTIFPGVFPSSLAPFLSLSCAPNLFKKQRSPWGLVDKREKIIGAAGYRLENLIQRATSKTSTINNNNGISIKQSTTVQVSHVWLARVQKRKLKTRAAYSTGWLQKPDLTSGRYLVQYKTWGVRQENKTRAWCILQQAHSKNTLVRSWELNKRINRTSQRIDLWFGECPLKTIFSKDLPFLSI